MTEKELLYFEDAIGHESNIISIINYTINNLNDDNLRNFMTNELDKHTNTKESLINLLKEKQNG